MKQPYFLFDLDGTVTTCEILPRIASALGLEAELDLLTHLTLTGTLDFHSSFKLRFQILRSIPLTNVHAIIAQVPLDPVITRFIQAHSNRCALVTGNLDLWITPLTRQLGCPVYSSRGRQENGTLFLDQILDKGTVAATLRQRHHPLIAIGESVNDIPMLRQADIPIAYAGVHQPVPDVLALSTHTFHNADALCSFLKKLLG